MDWPASGLALQLLARETRSLDAKAFEARYARAFFIRHGASSAVPMGPMRTRLPSSEGGGTGEIVIVALPIRRRETSEHTFVGIGRLDGNDIAIFDETVSKFHAYVKEGPERTFVLQDAKSRNGTTVDDIAVAPRGVGPPVLLASGQTVRFGSVTTTFLDAAALLKLVGHKATAR